MNQNLTSAFEELTVAIKSNDRHSVKIDAALKTIAKEKNPASVAFLPLSLEDNFHFNEGCFR